MLEAVDRIEEFRSGYAKLGILSDGAAKASDAIFDLASRESL